MVSVNISNIAILNINGVNYCCIINRISKSEAVNLLQKADLRKIAERYKYVKNLFSNIKMIKRNFNVWQYWNWKNSILPLWKSYFCRDVDIKSLSVSNKISFRKNNYKYVIGYLRDYYKIKPLHKKLPKTKVYVKSCDGQTKWMYFLIENGDLIKKKQCYLG